MIAGVNAMLRDARTRSAMVCTLLAVTLVFAAAAMLRPASMLAQSGAASNAQASVRPDATQNAAAPQEPSGHDEARPSQEPARPRDHRVTGKVLDRDGKAVERAEIAFGGPKTGKVFSDARGEFAFTGPTGDYTATVKAGSRRQEFAVQIDNNQLKPSTLVIEPEGLL